MGASGRRRGYGRTLQRGLFDGAGGCRGRRHAGRLDGGRIPRPDRGTEADDSLPAGARRRGDRPSARRPSLRRGAGGGRRDTGARHPGSRHIDGWPVRRGTLAWQGRLRRRVPGLRPRAQGPARLEEPEPIGRRQHL
jgi:hypothetical protein